MNNRLLHALLTGVLIASFYSLMYLGGFFALWQDRATDSLFLPRSPHPDVVIIGIDNASLQSIGRWPWNRSIHAQLLERLGDGPAAVGYDISFPETSTASDDARLAQSFAGTRGTILPMEAGIVSVRSDRVLITRLLSPIPLFRQDTRTGIVNTLAGQDSITRHVPIDMVREDGGRQQHFSQALAETYARNTGKDVPYDTILTERGIMRINFIGRPGSFPIYSFSDVLEGKVPVETFRDKIVLIGVTAVDLRDNQITSVSGGQPMSGVEIHANALQTILEGSYLRNESKVATMVTIWFAALATAAVMSYLGLVAATLVVFGGIIGYIVYTFLSFDFGLIRNLVYPLFVLFTSYIALALYRYFVEYNQRRFLRKAFSYYVSPSVMDELLEDPTKLSLGGSRREMTVSFADIAGFTSISEKLPPDELSLMLNEYLTRASKIIFKYDGVIDKFIGDAIMAFWNAPLDDKHHALNSCSAALEMEEEVRKIREEWDHIQVKNFSVRIGINTGEMVVGNMGSDMRFDYTVLGDNVNLASRMEAINRVYGTNILIAQSTYEMVRDHVVVRLIDEVAVKGKKRGVKMYELRKMGKADAEEQAFLDAFSEALETYRRGDFPKALKLFKAFTEKYPADDPAKLYVSRCEEYIEDPPENFDGTYRPESK